MIVFSILPHAESGPNDCREAAPHFTDQKDAILKYHKSKFLYSLQLYDISLQFDPADQPIRLFQREKNTDSILLVIERENNLLPVRIITC